MTLLCFSSIWISAAGWCWVFGVGSRTTSGIDRMRKAVSHMSWSRPYIGQHQRRNNPGLLPRSKNIEPRGLQRHPARGCLNEEWSGIFCVSCKPDESILLHIDLPHTQSTWCKIPGASKYGQSWYRYRISQMSLFAKYVLHERFFLLFKKLIVNL